MATAAIRRITARLAVADGQIAAGAILAEQEPDSATQLLTPRQRQVADLVSRGYTNDGAARALKVSPKTIEKHLGDIYRRLAIGTRAALAAQWLALPT